METIPVSKELLLDFGVAWEGAYRRLVMEGLRAMHREATASSFGESWGGPRQELERLENGWPLHWDRRIPVEERCECCGQVIGEEW